MGQTILITAWLSPEQQDEHQWRNIADMSLAYFLDIIPEELPPFYQAGQLFDSPIFEYASEQQGHFIVWLFLTPENAKQYSAKADDNLGLFYQEFIDIFCYRHKILKSYQLSRKAYQEALGSYQEVKEISQINLSKADLNDTELQILQHKIRSLISLDLEYAKQLQALNNYQKTIAINTHNYSYKLQQIQAKFPQNNLEFLTLFIETIAPTYQQQIEKDLGYFQSGYNSIERILSSIRGIVEIEQAKREHRRLEAERSLERSIQVVGVGLATGAIVASVVSAHIEKPIKPFNFKYPLHPMVSSLFWSFFTAFLAGWLTYLWTKYKDSTKKLK